MAQITVKKIVEFYLRLFGYDGLTDGAECACELSDLFPCIIPGDVQNCRPGYKVPCDCDNECDFHIKEAE